MTSSISEASTLKETPCSSTDVSHQLLGIDWDPRNAAAAQDVNFNVTPPSHLYDVGLVHSQGIHCSSVGLLDPFPRFPCYNNGSFAEHISSFAHSGDGSIAHSGDGSIDKDFGGKKRKNLADSDSFDSRSQLQKVQNVQSEEQINPPLETAEVQIVKDDKRQVSDGNPWKTNLKQPKEQPQNADDAPKEDYIHVRAKRGQATNSHSLAERVRREKISERMRFLQNLVPGCSKITGKAVMLDEIINYVQSLQRQVEFLSMKLATVNPELNFDIEQMLPKDSSRVGNSAALMFDPGMNISNSHLHGFISQSEMAIPSVPSHIYHMPQASCLWEDEYQNIFQMGVSPNVHLSNTEQQPGSMKLG